jgi:DNA-binding FrmR family transcriptional regulator
MMGNAGEKDSRQDIKARLRRIEGQVRGIYRMVDEERECMDIMVQLTAVKAAVSRVGVLVLSNYLANCLGDDLVRDESVQENLEKFSELLRKWS